MRCGGHSDNWHGSSVGFGHDGIRVSPQSISKTPARPKKFYLKSVANNFE
jgi:hypothetical protein